eukprot:jgi/Psemu1/180397/e_gw1.14.222.1
MRKRKTEEEEDSEMEVDNEEGKIEMGDSEDEEIEGVEGVEDNDEDDTNPAVENAFLDSFYGLSAADPKDRSRAAQVMLQHCLLGDSANSKDASYAFRRLLNGLCSGRAAARQGNASALASFLKIAFHLEKMGEVKKETEKSSNDGADSLLSYVRERLITATDPQRTDGKKKGSEERDYQFGRLFGIHGVVRSGILLLPGDDDEVKEVASALVSDLVELFWEKKWMREPAAHGISAVLKLFLESTSETNQSIGRHLVENVVIPKVLIITQDDRSEESDFETLLQKYLPEQVGIGAHIQFLSKSSDLPFPLDQPIVSTKTLPWIGQALSETSVIVQPRTHFVWDTLWCYLSKKADSESSSNRKTKRTLSPSKYITRETIPCGEDKASSVIEAIMKIVVEEKLLHIDEGTSVAKTTHERRALALCIVRNLSGAPFVSALSGPTQIFVDCDLIESIILTPVIIRSLFTNVICAGKNKREASHLLKPLALDVLDSLVESVAESGDVNRQLACLKAFSNCDPRFDARTKTNAISSLLSSSSETVTTAFQFDLLGRYLTHLETKMLELCGNANDSSAEANGYIELLHACAKQALHKSKDEDEKDDDAEFAKSKESIVTRVIRFFMSLAFFDCSTVSKPTQKKGKKPPSAIIESALKVKASLKDGQKIAHGIRAIAAARFFTLVSDLAMTTLHESKDDYTLLVQLEELNQNWNELESTKAKRYASTEKDEDDAESPEIVIKALISKVNDLREKANGDNDNQRVQSETRCCTGIAVLAMTLHLHRLSCGSDDDEMDDDPDADEEEDEENICNAIQDLEAVSKDFMEGQDSDFNPLLGLAEVCANILSSPLGSGDIGRGAAPKLVREAVRCAWLGGLGLASAVATKEKSLLNDEVTGLLIDAIGASNNNEEEPGDDEEGDSDEDASDDDSEDDGIVFSKASDAFEDPDDMETDDPATSDKDDDESDVELDPSKLHTMLEDDNLDDVDDLVLEHHEGADAALAKLIKLKQEARKAGIEAREKIELSNQLRCTLLIELMFTKSDAWKNLFQINNIMKMVTPMLDCRKRIGKSLQKAIESGGKSGTEERKQLLQRLNTLIKQKLCKVRLSSMPLSSEIDTAAATNIIQEVMKEAKNSKEKEYQSCCSSSLIFLFRMMPSTAESISLASTEYGDIVQKWSTKRGSGASLLEDFISHMPELAQASLHGALNRAAEDARKPIIKMEVFRLLSLLFGSKPNADGASEMEKVSQAKIHESQDALLNTINKTLNDEEMVKPKRARGVFIALEKMLPFFSSPASNDALDSLASIKIEISGLGDKHDGLKVIASRLVEQINAKLETLKPVPATPEGDNTVTKPSSSKKKSKKKKKKKLY